ncbi:MAG: hypothetical protein V3U79_06735 [Dehalococcoidia bacterium]
MDLLVVNGRVVTMASDGKVAEAVGIRRGKIVAVGANQEILDGRRADAMGERWPPLLFGCACLH